MIMEFLKGTLPKYHGYFKTIEKYKKNDVSHYKISVKRHIGYIKIENGKVFLNKETDYSFNKPKKES